MALIRMLFKLLALPLIVVITIIQWVGIFLTGFSEIIFNLFAGLIFLITVIGFAFGVAGGAEALKMLAVSFVIFIIPYIAEWLIVRVATLNYELRDFIKS